MLVKVSAPINVLVFTHTLGSLSLFLLHLSFSNPSTLLSFCLARIPGRMHGVQVRRNPSPQRKEFLGMTSAQRTQCPPRVRATPRRVSFSFRHRHSCCCYRSRTVVVGWVLLILGGRVCERAVGCTNSMVDVVVQIIFLSTALLGCNPSQRVRFPLAAPTLR